jgi:hypothetical protein
MLAHARLVTLILVIHNGCGSPCPEIECDDLINLVFSSQQSGDYRVTFEGQDHLCAGGEPQSSGLAACGPAGALLRSSATAGLIEVQGEGWNGSIDGTIERVRPLNNDAPECEVPCTRGEIVVVIP